MTSKAPLDVCVVCHTHWDREWYHPLARFRQRLVSLIDSVIAAPGPGHPAPAPFLLDGQAITLLDYVQIRSEQDSALRDRLQRGALEAGPWFVLADNLIPSGEAILRNLEAGRRVLRRFGATPPPVAYCPDTFGHPAALPAIAAGYGFPVAILWRGFGGQSHPATDAFQWVGPDGSAVLVHHLPPDGYEVGSALPATQPEAEERWSRLAALFAARNHTGVVLLPNGADHHALQPDIVPAIAALHAASAPAAHIHRTTLAEFADRFAQAATRAAIPTVHGELRDSYGYTWTLGGTLSTRAHQKRRNARLERALVRDVEPWLAHLWLAEATHQRDGRNEPSAADGSFTLVQLRSLLHAVWQELLETHPHDTLCGCSIDTVARAMDARQESVASQIVGLRAAALDLLLERDSVSARATPVNEGVVVVRNRSAAARGGIAEVQIIETLGDVGVGPGGAAPPYPDASHVGTVPHSELNDCVTQRLATRVQHLRRESPQHYPDNDLVRMHRALAWVPELPAYGVRVFTISKGSHAASHSAPVPPGPQVHVTDADDSIVLFNDALRVTVHAGMVSITHAGREHNDVLSLETIRDLGDSYTPSLRGEAERLRCVSAHVLHRGPLRAAVQLRWESAARDVRVTTVLMLDAGDEQLRCDVQGVNHKRDHRLRLLWRTGLPSAITTADAAFGPVTRERATAPAWTRESVVPTMPLHRWAAHTTGSESTVLISDGLAEAESAPGMLAVTLLRAIGELSRHDLPERPGHAGWPAPTPDSQSLGRFRAKLGVLLLHAASEEERLLAISYACDRLLLPLTGSTVRDLDLAHTQAISRGVELRGRAFELSAITLAEYHEGIVLRAVNRTSAHAHGSWQLPHAGPWLVRRCRLDETPIEEAHATGAVIDFAARPREIVTLVVTTLV